ncbi:hypothetical protein D1007_22669 [Hordeum vulgare]|nr:hypothetical protein D1007_22669 [Hordeum vulgare]
MTCWRWASSTTAFAVCDVPDSMSVSLGLLLSELCDEPWRHRVITFSMRPQLHHVAGDTLWDKAQFIQRMDWQTNTDFQAVFDQLLHVAVAGNLPPESMVKKVTDMTILATARLQQRKG